MNSVLTELYISEHLYRRWENNRGEREISYQDSHYSGYSPRGGLLHCDYGYISDWQQRSTHNHTKACQAGCYCIIHRHSLRGFL